MPAAGQVLNFSEALPGLRAARRAGRLVPFVGAGISRPYCRGWPQFIAALYEQFSESASNVEITGGPEALYRAADRVAAWLRLRPTEERLTLLRQALFDHNEVDLPPQVLALTSCDWPLIITTNYDDLIPRAFRQRSGLQASRDVAVLGRSREDCARVLRSLDILDDPIVWHIQGYAGGETERRRLLDEVVVGHQQYQQAINASISFRRAFSEIFRRCSLLFVGSGLAESYFVNLIAEVLFSLGPSSQPHFALFCDVDLEGKVDPDFLAVRLGITPVRYGASHAELAGALDAIANDKEGSSARQLSFGLTGTSYVISRGEAVAPASLAIELQHRRIPPPSKGGCVILSVGRDQMSEHFRPGLGRQAQSFLREHVGYLPALAFDDVPGLPQGRMFRVRRDSEPLPIFLLAARELDLTLRDREARSLAVITEATQAALASVESMGFEEVAMGLLAAGPHRSDAPPYCLLAQLAGIRGFAETGPTAPGIAVINISIIDDTVWSPLVQGRIPVLEVLTSRMARVLIRVKDVSGGVEEFALSVPHGAKIGDALAPYHIAEMEVDIAARPLPRGSYAEFQNTQVFPGMVIEVWPRLCQNPN